LAPGESTVVELIFKTRAYKTRISKYATVYSNDPGQPTAKIHLAANVYPSTDTTLPFTFLPDKVSLSQDSKKSKIILENKSESRLRIESAEDLEGLKLKIKNDDPKPGQKAELRFEWKSEFEKENVERSITFLAYGDGVDSSRFSIPVVLTGTDPTPPAKARTPKKTTTKRSTATHQKTVRRSARQTTTKADDPKMVKSEKLQKAKKLPTAEDKKSVDKETSENATDDTKDPSDTKSEDNQ
jgi:hypothetical protein